MTTGAWITWRLITRWGGVGGGGGPTVVSPDAITVSSDSSVSVVGTTIVAIAGPIAITSGLTIDASGFVPRRQVDLLDNSPCDNKVDPQNQIVVPTPYGIAPVVRPVISPPTLTPIPHFNIPTVEIPPVTIGDGGSYNYLFDFINSERYRDWLFQYSFSKMPLIFSYDGVLVASESPPYKAIRSVQYTTYNVQCRIAAGSGFFLYANVCAADGTMILTYNLWCDGAASYTGSTSLILEVGQYLYVSCQATTTATDVTVTFYNP